MTPRRPLATALVPVLALLAGCVTERPANRPQPKPQPAQVTVGKVWISSTPPQDTDVNGFFDTVDLTIYLFAPNFPASILVPGEFTFELHSKSAPDAKPIVTWQISKEAAAAATGSSAVGPYYFFRLSLLDRGGDVMADQTADLVATFTPERGGPVKEVVTFRVGRLRS